MLTIKNKERINGMHIQFKDITWYVHMIEDCVNWDLTTKENYPFYGIRLKNYVDNKIKDIELKREFAQNEVDSKTGLGWYKLSCVSEDGRERIQYISNHALKDMDNLLKSIKIVIE